MSLDPLKASMPMDMDMWEVFIMNPSTTGRILEDIASRYKVKLDGAANMAQKRSMLLSAIKDQAAQIATAGLPKNPSTTGYVAHSSAPSTVSKETIEIIAATVAAAMKRDLRPEETKLKDINSIIGKMKGKDEKHFKSHLVSLKATFDSYKILKSAEFDDVLAEKVPLKHEVDAVLYNVLVTTLHDDILTNHIDAVNDGEGCKLLLRIKSEFGGARRVRQTNLRKELQKMTTTGTVVEIMAKARDLHKRMRLAGMRETEHDIIDTLIIQLQETSYKECVNTILATQGDVDFTFAAFEDNFITQAAVRNVKGTPHEKKKDLPDTDGTVMALKQLQQDVARLTRERTQERHLKDCWCCDGKHMNPRLECETPSDSVKCDQCKVTGHLTKWHDTWYRITPPTVRERLLKRAATSGETSKTIQLTSEHSSIPQPRDLCTAVSETRGNVKVKEDKYISSLLVTVDSACSESATGDQTILHNTTPRSRTFTIANGDTVTSELAGTLSAPTHTKSGKVVTFSQPNTNYIPSLPDTLISVGQLVDQAHTVVYQPGTSFIHPCNQPIKVPEDAIPLHRQGNVWKLPLEVQQTPTLQPMVTRSHTREASTTSGTTHKVSTNGASDTTTTATATTTQSGSTTSLEPPMSSPPATVPTRSHTPPSSSDWTPRPTEPTCDHCLASFPSRNQLFKHLGDQQSTCWWSRQLPRSGTPATEIPTTDNTTSSDTTTMDTATSESKDSNPSTDTPAAQRPLRTADILNAQQQLQTDKTAMERAKAKLLNTYHRLLQYHRRFSHVSLPAVKENLKRCGTKDNLDLIDLDLIKCAECATSNIRKSSLGGQHADRSHRPCQVTHIDVVGPINPITPSGYLYTFYITDDYLRERHTFHAMSCGGAAAIRCFKKYVARMGGLEKFKGGTIHSDWGVFQKDPFAQFCHDNIIRLEASTPERQALNGIVESSVDVTNCMVRADLLDSGVPANLWAYAVDNAAYLQNHLITKPLGMSAYEKRHGKAPDLSIFHVFGCKVVAKDYRNKLDDILTTATASGKKSRARRRYDPKGITGVNLGIDRDCSHATYIIGIPDDINNPTKIISTRRSRDVQFFDDDYVFKPATSDSLSIVYNNIVSGHLETPGGKQEHLPTTAGALNALKAAHTTTTENDHRGNINNDVSNEEPTDEEDGIIHLIHLDPDNDTPVVHGKLYTRPTTHYEATILSMNETLQSYTSIDTSCPIPTSYKEAMKSTDRESWKRALQKEFTAFRDKKVYSEVHISQVPGGRKIYKVFNLFKRKSDGTYKVRSVLNGRVVSSADISETFSPTSTLENFRAILASESLLRKFRATDKRWVRRAFDVNNAFLNAVLDQDIYCYAPDGFYDDDPRGSEAVKGLVWKLNKALYGLPQAPRLYYLTFDAVAHKLGLLRSDIDPCIYYKVDSQGETTAILNVHVDDNYIVGVEDVVENLILEVKKEFDIKDLGDTEVYLGLEARTDEEGDIHLTQTKMIEDILQEFNLKNDPVPYVPHVTKRLEPLHEGEERTTMPYNKLVGSLVYPVRGTHPELAYDLLQLSRQLKNPGDEHYQAGLRALRFLGGASKLALPMKAVNTDRLIEVWVDSDHVGDKGPESTSIGGYYITIAGVTVAWQSKVAHSTCLSASDAEMIALELAIRKAIALAKLLVDVRVIRETESTIYVNEDNHGVIKSLLNPLGTAKLRHLRIKLSWIREAITRGTIKLMSVKSADNGADIFTKPLPNVPFHSCWKRINSNVIYNLPEDKGVETQEGVSV